MFCVNEAVIAVVFLAPAAFVVLGCLAHIPNLFALPVIALRRHSRFFQSDIEYWGRGLPCASYCVSSSN